MCLGQGADLYMAQLMPLPLTLSRSSKSRLVLPPGFTFLVLAHPGSPGQNPRGHILKFCYVLLVRVIVWWLF